MFELSDLHSIWTLIQFAALRLVPVVATVAADAEGNFLNAPGLGCRVLIRNAYLPKGSNVVPFWVVYYNPQAKIGS